MNRRTVKPGIRLWLTFVLCVSLSGLLDAAPDRTEDYYQRARREFYQLMDGDPHARTLRHRWERVINAFDNVVLRNPKHIRVPEAIFTIGTLYERMYDVSRLRSDSDNAIDHYERLTREFPKSHLVDDALLKLAQIYETKRADSKTAYNYYERISLDHPSGDMAQNARRAMRQLAVAAPTRSIRAVKQPTTVKSPTRLSSTPATVTDIRFWTHPNYTKVVIYLDHETAFTENRLERDDRHDHPERLYFDLKNSELRTDLRAKYRREDGYFQIPIGDGLLTRARFAQHSIDTVRVVLDIASIKEHRVVPYENPYRINIDVWGKNSASPPITEPMVRAPRNRPGTKEPKSSHPRLRRTGGPITVVVDAGHGGKDVGAIGRLGTQEKDVSLAIARYVKQLLARYPSIKAVMSREGDDSVSLEDRTAKANQVDADLFVSIHANAFPDSTSSGIETYFLNISHRRYNKRLAVVENETSERALDDLQFTLLDLAQSEFTRESVSFANAVQASIVNGLQNKWENVRDRGVHSALFYVLLGVRMPAILVETSFLSNETEERRLRDPVYLERLAQGIVEGILDYLADRDARLRIVKHGNSNAG